MSTESAVKRRAAQRQAAYRQRHLQGENAAQARLNTLIDAAAKAQLERLAQCYGLNQRTVLENLLDQAEQLVLARLQWEGQASADYYQGRSRLSPPWEPKENEDD
jgi:hypothetical protein